MSNLNAPETNDRFVFNAFDPDFIANPLPYMQRGLEESPVVRHEKSLDPLYSIFRFDDVKSSLLNWETF